MSSEIEIQRKTKSGNVISTLRTMQDNNKELMSRGNSGFKVHPSVLEEQPGYNTRTAGFTDPEEYFELPEVEEHIENLARAYERGDYVPPISAQMVDGHLYVRQGHCRRRGLLRAISRGADIREVAIEEFTGDEAKQELFTLTGNRSLALSAVAIAASYDRLVNRWGQSIADVAKAEGKTEVHIRNMLKVNDMPLDLKRLIITNVVSADNALKQFSKHGTKAAAIITEAANKNGGKASAKQLDGYKLPKALHGDTVSMIKTFATIDAEPFNKGDDILYKVTLNHEQMTELMALHDKIKEQEEKELKRQQKKTESGDNDSGSSDE